MSSETAITKESLNEYLKDLGKEFRKLNGKKMPAEVILIGGAAVLANYGFREMTYDIDAIILSSSIMKEAINRVGDKHGLPNGWLSTDFMKTTSFSKKLLQISKYYRTYSNILTIRIVTAEYLIAMKLMSGREYKYDLSDIAGILFEQQEKGSPLSRGEIDRAVAMLYGEDAELPEVSRKFIDNAFADGDYERIFKDIRKNEIETGGLIFDFERDNPGILKEEGLAAVLEKARGKLK